ncbi:prostaglandin G/H synthase 2-like [Styela clava]
MALFTLTVFGLIAVINAEEIKYNPCCSNPCENFGICNRIAWTEKYTCDCYGTGYYGVNCQTPTWSKWISNLLRPSPFTVQAITTNGKIIWKIVNKIKFVHSYFMKFILKIRALSPEWPEPHNTAADYITWDGYTNKTYWGRTLPAVPEDCPTPFGVVGPKEYPDVYKLVEEVFTRTEFKPCPRGTSLSLPLYGQHFTHQGFKSVPSDDTLTWGQHTLDMSHLYGETLGKQLALRSMKGGKMKTQIINGEEYPPNMKDCPGVNMDYPENVIEEYRFAMGHPFFALLPSLMYYSTLWLREHNRVCDVLAEHHPQWDDERLFQTTRLIILGETLKVTVEEYVQHISGMDLKLTFEPDLMHDSSMRWASGRLHVEFNTLYHWHNMIPNYFYIGNKTYTLEETFFNMSSLLDNGMNVFTTSMANQVAGRGAGGRNMAKSLHKVAYEVIKMNRKLRLQPFNRYRELFRLPPYKTFEELTGETKLAKVLSKFYGGEINAVEYFVGIMVEKRYKAKMWGITLTESIGNYALRSVFSNVIGSPQYWKESTFGGKIGFDMVKTASLKDIACRNIKGCPEFKFEIAEAVTEDTDKGMIYNDIESDGTEGTGQHKTEL